MSSVAYANKILDEAERKLLKNYSKADLIDLVNKAWSIGTNGSQYQFSELAKNGRLNATGAKYTNVAVGILGAGGNWIIADANNKKLDEKLVGVGVDAALIAVGFIPGVGQVLNVALIGASLAGLDISGWIKSKYRGDKIDSLDWVSITKSGFLQVTMPDGTVYARPFLTNAHGSLFGDTKDDVLFGGNGKDIFIGHGGNDIFVGNGGKDDYLVSYGDTIIDSDGKGRVFLGSSHQLKGGTQIEFQKQDEKLKYEKQIKDISVFLENEKDMRENNTKKARLNRAYFRS